MYRIVKWAMTVIAVLYLPAALFQIPIPAGSVRQPLNIGGGQGAAVGIQERIVLEHCVLIFGESCGNPIISIEGGHGNIKRAAHTAERRTAGDGLAL